MEGSGHVGVKIGHVADVDTWANKIGWMCSQKKWTEIVGLDVQMCRCGGCSGQSLSAKPTPYDPIFYSPPRFHHRPMYIT